MSDDYSEYIVTGVTGRSSSPGDPDRIANMVLGRWGFIPEGGALPDNLFLGAIPASEFIGCYRLKVLKQGAMHQAWLHQKEDGENGGKLDFGPVTEVLLVNDHNVFTIEGNFLAKIVVTCKPLVQDDESAELRSAPYHVHPSFTESAIAPVPMEIVDSSQKVHAELMNIRVDRIRRNKEQPRKKFHRGDLLILGLSLKDQGQTDRVEVIRVYGDPDADFELVKGERRWRAAQLVGMVELRAIISPPSEIPNKDVQHRVCLISDSHHSKYSDVEIAFALARERAKGNYTLQQLATMCKKKSSAWVAQHLAITNLHPELLKLLNPDLPRPKQMSFAIAWRIARLTPVEQLDVYDKVSRIKGAKLQLIEVEKLVSSKHPKEARKKSSADYYKNLGIMVPRMLADASMAEGFPSESFLSLIKHRPHDEVEQIIKRIDETVQHLRTLKSRIVDARESWERCTRV